MAKGTVSGHEAEAQQALDEHRGKGTDNMRGSCMGSSTKVVGGRISRPVPASVAAPPDPGHITAALPMGDGSGLIPDDATLEAERQTQVPGRISNP